MAKRRRRSPGTGIANKEKNGTWTARFPKLEGGYHARRGFSTRAAAEDWCDSLLKLRDDKHDVKQSLRYLNDRIDAWIKRENVERSWKAKMLADVQFKLGYVKPYLGAMAMGDVLPDHVDHMLTELAEDLKPNTIRQIRNYLYQVFDDACQRRHIAFNPVLKPRRRKRPKQKEAERLSVSQTAILVDAGETFMYGLIWWLLVCCGLRSGEICGLRRVDVDLETCTLSIRQAAPEVRGKTQIDLPKNDKFRDVPFPRAMVPYLQAHMDMLTKRAARAMREGRWQEHGLIFPGRGGKPMNPTSVRHALKRLTDSVRLPPVTTHMLRHTAGGLLRDAECPQDVIGALFGHEPTNITGHYAPPSVNVMRPWVEKIYRELSREVARQRKTNNA